MKANLLLLSFALGLILCTNALAQQTYERDPVPPRHGAAERMEPVELRSNTPLREFPSDIFFPSAIFNERRIQELERAGITNVGQLIEADPRRLGMSLGLNPREVKAAQRKIRGSMR